jgi:hypothetical protein
MTRVFLADDGFGGLLADLLHGLLIYAFIPSLVSPLVHRDELRACAAVQRSRRGRRGRPSSDPILDEDGRKSGPF